jgi:hypothetical protein
MELFPFFVYFSDSITSRPSERAERTEIAAAGGLQSFQISLSAAHKWHRCFLLTLSDEIKRGNRLRTSTVGRIEIVFDDIAQLISR